MDNTTKPDAKSPNASAAKEPESVAASKQNLPTSSAMTKDENNQSSSLLMPENSASGECKSGASMDMSKSAAEAPKSSSAPDGQQANFEETVSSRNTSKSAAPDRALLQKIPESPQNQTAGPQNKQDKQNTADADKSSQNCSKAPEHAKSPEKSKLMLKLKASPQKKAQQQGKLKKRRHSNQQQQGDGGPPKKKKAKGNRRSDPNFRMLPNKFLEGGIQFFFDYFFFLVIFLPLK